MARFDECVARVAKLGAVSEAEARQILQQVDDLAQAKRLAGEADPAMAAAYDLAGRIKQAARDTRLDALRNLAIRRQVLTRIDTEGGLAKAADVLRSTLHWVPGATRLDSVEGLWHGTSKSWQAVVGNKLRQAGLDRAALSGELDKDVARHMWDMNAKGDGAEAPGKSPAAQIANALKPALDLARARMNAAGAHIGTALDYVTHTNWDPRQLRLAAGKGATPDEAFASWWAKDGPRMADKTLEHLVPEGTETLAEAKLRFARSLFDATASGVHMTHPSLGGLADDGTGYIPPAYEGSRNIARGVSQSRTVFWKDSDSWLDHMQEFGGGHGLYAQTMQSLNSAARNMALMDRLGTNPKGNLATIVRRVQETYRADLDGLAQFNSKIAGLDNVLARLDGTANMPHNADWARRFEYAMTLEATAHLGGVSVTHIAAAPATLTAELTHHGVSHLAGLGHTLKAIVTGRGPAEAQEALAEAGAYASGYNLDMHTRWQPGSGVPGVTSWLAANFMKLTGLEHFLGQFQAQGIKSVLMTKLGAGAGAELAKLDPLQASLLKRYGIADEEWNALRSAEPFTVEGQRYITPRDAATAPEAAIKEILRRKGIWSGQEPLPGLESETLARAVQKERWQLGDKLNMYYNDASEHATVTPGARERAMVYGNLRPGSLNWMLARSVTQFKMWPLAALNQIVGREIAYSVAAKGSLLGAAGQIGMNVGWLLALSTAGGAVRMSVNDAASGRPQRNYLEGATLLAALAQGGGLGIFGDFMFGETNRMGAGIVSTAMGPIAADVDRLIKIYSRFREDLHAHPDKAFQHMWPDAAHFAVGHVPFANLIYLKGALDYMLWYHLYEAASPGWWERTNRRLIKEQGRGMSGYMPGQGIPWTPPIGLH